MTQSKWILRKYKFSNPNEISCFHGAHELAWLNRVLGRPVERRDYLHRVRPEDPESPGALRHWQRLLQFIRRHELPHKCTLVRGSDKTLFSKAHIKKNVNTWHLKAVEIMVPAWEIEKYIPRYCLRPHPRMYKKRTESEEPENA